MIITHHGVDFVKIQVGDFVLAVNPISKQSKFDTTRFGADLILVSSNHVDTNGIELVNGGSKTPFIINGPGEYEIMGNFVHGFLSQTHYGGDEKINTIYNLMVDGINLCFLGLLDGDLPSEVKAGLGDIDILFVPIGGNGVLNAMEASKIAVKLEAKLIIPLHYGAIGDKDALKVFLEESEADKAEKLDKLTVKRKDLDGKDGEVVILTAQK